MPSPSLLQRLKERKIVQWALAYLAGAFVVFQAVEVMAEPWSISPAVQRGIHILLLVGLFITLILAWYHGEKGRQRVSGPELLMVAALLVVAGGVLSMLGREEGVSTSPATVSSSYVQGDKPGIAVLLCANLSTDPEDEYLAAGLHDEILLKLQKISSLFSIGRTSVLQYAEDPPATNVIASALGVGFVGECSVRKYGSQIRLIFQLLEGNTGGQIWAEDYDMDLTVGNLLDIQSDIARQVAHAVGVVLTGEEQARIDAIPTTNLDAYELYLLGRNRWTTRSPETIREAIGYYEAAIEIDPTFALAHSGIADAYMVLPFYDLTTEPLDVYERAKAAATRAYELDPSIGEVHASLGFISHLYELDWEAAELYLSSAVELVPGYPSAHHWYGSFLSSVGRFEEALEETERALSLDPSSNVLVWASADRLSVVGRTDEARERWRQAITMDPPILWALPGLATDLGLHEPTDPVRAGELLVDFASHHGYPFPGRLVSVAEAMTGGRESQESAVAVLNDLAERTELDRPDLLFLYSASAPPDVYFDVLEAAVRNRHLWVAFFPLSTLTDRPDLREDPRYERFLTRIGYPGPVE
jgi:TolB-like protein